MEIGNSKITHLYERKLKSLLLAGDIIMYQIKPEELIEIH